MSEGKERAMTRAKLEDAIRHPNPQDGCDDNLEWPLFKDWEIINGKAELMDGQY
jgi:hypothetical protein